MEGLYIYWKKSWKGGQSLQARPQRWIFVYSLEQGVRKFVGFEWKDTLKAFIILYFGLGSEPGLKKKKKRVIIYLDGFLILRRTLDDVIRSKDTIIFPLKRLNFVMNIKKVYSATYNETGIDLK